jgi:hypothetical protein
MICHLSDFCPLLLPSTQNKRPFGRKEKLFLIKIQSYMINIAIQKL